MFYFPQSFFLFFLLFFAIIIPHTLAADCTESDSLPWPFGELSDISSSSSDSPPVGSTGGGEGEGEGAVGAGGPGGGGSTTDECAAYADDATQYQICQENALKGQENSQNAIKRKRWLSLMLERRDDDTPLLLNCKSGELCYRFSNDSLLCFESITSDYYDDAGGKGNFIKGTYSRPSGEKGETPTISESEPSSSSATTHNTPFSTQTPPNPNEEISTSTSTSSTAKTVSNAAAGTATTTGTTAGTAAATGASATTSTNGGGEGLRACASAYAHAAIGALAAGVVALV